MYSRYNRKTVSIKTPPSQEVVSLSDMKTYLKVDGTADDTLIGDLIESAQSHIRNYLRRSLITETLVLQMDGFTDYGDDVLLSLGAGVHTGSRSYYLGYPDSFDLPFIPIQEINSIKYYDKSNTINTFSADKYQIDNYSGRVFLNEGETWATNLRPYFAVEVDYDSGYGDTSASIPEPIIQAVKILVSNYYDCRDVCEMPEACMRLLSPYKILDNMVYA